MAKQTLVLPLPLGPRSRQLFPSLRTTVPSRRSLSWPYARALSKSSSWSSASGLRFPLPLTSSAVAMAGGLLRARKTARFCAFKHGMRYSSINGISFPLVGEFGTDWAPLRRRRDGVVGKTGCFTGEEGSSVVSSSRSSIARVVRERLGVLSSAPTAAPRFFEGLEGPGAATWGSTACASSGSVNKGLPSIGPRSTASRRFLGEPSPATSAGERCRLPTDTAAPDLR